MIKNILAVGLLVGSFVVLGFGLRALDNQSYNNGICTECSGNYEYVRAIEHSSYIEFEYECENCGKTIRTETRF